MPENKGTFKVTYDIRGEIVGVRKVQDRGRVQIPPKIREALDLKDGDEVYWIHGIDGRFYIIKAKPLY